MTDKERAMEALERAGYRKCRNGRTWVDYLNDEARRIVTLEHGAAVIITSQADLAALLTTGYIAEQVEAAVWAMPVQGKAEEEIPDDKCEAYEKGYADALTDVLDRFKQNGGTHA